MQNNNLLLSDIFLVPPVYIPAEKFIGIDFAMQGMCVFSTNERAKYPMFYRHAEKKLAREQRKLSRCQKGSQNYKKQKKRDALCHEKIRNQRKDFQHKLSTSLAESYDAVCVEDLNLKGMAGGFHFGKGVHDNGYGLFLSMLEYKLEERGKYLIKVDRYFPSFMRFTAAFTSRSILFPHSQ